jgi:hypothetical protein
MIKLDIHHYIEIAALLISLLMWTFIRKSFLKWFLPFLLFIVAVELTGKYIASILHKNNGWLYNLSIPVEYLFYSFIIYQSVKSASFKKLILFAAGIFFVYIIYTNFISPGIMKFNAGFLFYGSGLMVLLSCLFFWDLFSETFIVSLVKHPVFWIVTGLFLFNLGEFSYNLFADMLFIRGDKTGVFFRQINNYLNLVLYICISIGLLCSRISVETSASKV